MTGGGGGGYQVKEDVAAGGEQLSAYGQCERGVNGSKKSRPFHASPAKHAT